MASVMKSVKTLAILLSLASGAFADEVVLRNGSVLNGLVREEGDRVIVEMDFGTMSFKKIDVRSITRGQDPMTEYDAKLKAATDIKGMVEVAAWAREKGLGTRATDLYRKILTLDSDQPDARKALGYEKVNGQWLAGDDLMVARGFVKVNGKWLTKETAELLLHQQESSRAELERLALEKRIADQRHEQEMTKIGIERDKLELERQRGDYFTRYGYLYPGAYGAAAGCGYGYIMPGTLPVAQPLPPSPPTVIPLGQPSPLPPSRPR
jgi:hypothetical protein